jgi:hypothetical protein
MPNCGFSQQDLPSRQMLGDRPEDKHRVDKSLINNA